GGAGDAGAGQAVAADAAEDLVRQGVEGAPAAAVGGDGDPGPGPVGVAGSCALALHGGREELVDGDVVPQGSGGGEAVPGAGSFGVTGEPGTGDGAADESRPEDETGRGGHELRAAAPCERPARGVLVEPLRLA